MPRPLTCIHVDGNPDLQTFFAGATQANGIPLDAACESYYPGWHGPLTETQQAWHPCNATDCGSKVQHAARTSMYTEANGLGLPIFTMEDGVAYSPAQGRPQDPLRREPARALADPLPPGHDRSQQGRGEHP